MSRATDAVLAYGYDLGGPTAGWQVREADAGGGLPPLGWYAEGDENDYGFVTAVAERLLTTVAGFTEQPTPRARANGYHDRHKAAQARVGVQVEMYGSSIAPAYLLAAHVITVRRGDVEPVDGFDLIERPRAQDWDERLTAALAALCLTPLQARPAWLLASYADF